MEINDTSVEVLYDFEYPLPKSGKKVCIKEGERLFLIKKTNDDWWQVIRSTERRPFYVPSTYVREILPARRSSTSSLGRNNDKKFTVSINIKQKPVVAKPRTSIATASKSNIKVSSIERDKDQRDNKAIESNELSDSDKKNGGGYSVVRVKKAAPEYGEANILEEEQHLSESLTELARQIAFRPAREAEPRGEFFRRLDGLKYAGSFKTKHERKKILDRQISGSWPDLTTSDRPESESKSMENLESDSENNLVERPSITVVTFPGNASDRSNNNWRQDDSDSERLGSDITESSCESLNPTVFKPVAKPRRVYKAQEEVIYANCLELRALENEEANKDSKKASDSPSNTLKDPDTEREVIKELSTPKDFSAIEISKEFIRHLELKTAQLSRQQRSSSGEYEEEKGQIERNENEKSGDEHDWGRRFFKKEKKRKSSEKENENKSKEVEGRGTSNSQEARVTPPLGWTSQPGTDSQLPRYIHTASGKKWYSATNAEGRVYFYEENGGESSWTLPDLSNPPSGSPTALDHQDEYPDKALLKEELTAVFQKISTSGIDPTKRIRSHRAVSMIVPDKRDEEVNINKDWPQLNDGKICVLLEGPLHYTKINEGGKKVKKSWSSAYVVLTELFILIYKDLKSFHSQKSSPEVTIDLNGATVGSGENVSKGRKHVLLVTTQLGYDFALQCENTNSACHWANNIQKAIKNLPKGIDVPSSKFSGQLGECPEERKGGTGMSRSKSFNFKNKDDSMEDLGSTPAERQLKIKARLKKFFHKRPSMEHLVKKGIWKDEPVFGCFLDQACGNNNPRVPPFVQKCISCIETDENMKTDGLYRASGNLSQIQKIRLQIDQHNYGCLEQEEDVHVLTGALKLFFRELKEPLIPYKQFPKAIQASMHPERKVKIKQLQEIVKSLPSHNRDTLKCLLQHLLKVSEYKDSNRMHINNVAIVFGPTLMWPEHESANMALDMMQQNMVIEALLNDYDVIFK